jgi:tRNA wybutosine-synthesizing protein 3
MSGPNQRDAALSSLDEAVREGRADPEVLPLLSVLNSYDCYATTSSCAGRVQLIGVPEVGDKQGSQVFGKWHNPVTVEELLQAMPESTDGVFLMAQPLLLHVRCRDLRSAVDLWRTAHGSGLKYTTIRSIQIEGDGCPSEWGVTVEVQGTERMEVPLSGIPRDDLERCLPGWVRHGNALLLRTRDRMEAFVRALEEGRNKE